VNRDSQWTEPQHALMEIIWGTLWDPPCQHFGREWTIDAAGVARCTMCPAKWTMADEEERAARIAGGPPAGESDQDRMWRQFREQTHKYRPMIMRLPVTERSGQEP
jgi:hypothetical protein